MEEIKTKLELMKAKIGNINFLRKSLKLLVFYRELNLSSNEDYHNSNIKRINEFTSSKDKLLNYYEENKTFKRNLLKHFLTLINEKYCNIKVEGTNECELPLFEEDKDDEVLNLLLDSEKNLYISLIDLIDSIEECITPIDKFRKIITILFDLSKSDSSRIYNTMTSKEVSDLLYSLYSLKPYLFIPIHQLGIENAGVSTILVNAKDNDKIKLFDSNLNNFLINKLIIVLLGLFNVHLLHRDNKKRCDTMFYDFLMYDKYGEDEFLEKSKNENVNSSLIHLRNVIDNNNTTNYLVLISSHYLSSLNKKIINGRFNLLLAGLKMVIHLPFSWDKTSQDMNLLIFSRADTMNDDITLIDASKFHDYKNDEDIISKIKRICYCYHQISDNDSYACHINFNHETAKNRGLVLLPSHYLNDDFEYCSHDLNTIEEELKKAYNELMELLL